MVRIDAYYNNVKEAEKDLATLIESGIVQYFIENILYQSEIKSCNARQCNLSDYSYYFDNTRKCNEKEIKEFNESIAR